MNDSKNENKKSKTTLDFKQNKIAKIIFLKTISLPVLTLILGILFISFSSLSSYLDMQKIKDKNTEILAKIQKTQKDTKNMIAQSESIKRKLIATNKNIIDKNRVRPLVQKIVDYLTLQSIIEDAHINIYENHEYQNVLNINIQVKYNKNILNQEVLQNIFILVFKKIFYIKDISIQDRQINMQIYKEV